MVAKKKPPAGSWAGRAANDPKYKSRTAGGEKGSAAVKKTTEAPLRRKGK